MRSKLTKNIVWLGFSRIFIQGYTFAVTLYIANLLSPNDYALMGIAMILIEFTNLMTEFGLGEVIVQRKHITNTEISSIFWIALVIGFIATLSCYILAKYVGLFFNKPEVTPLIRMLSIVLFLKSLSTVPYKLIVKKLSFHLKAKIDMLASFISVSSAALFAYHDYGVWSLVYAQILFSLSITILSFIFEPVRLKIIIKNNNILSMLSFAFSIVGLRFVYYFRRSFDKIIAGKFLSNLDFGYYSFAFKLTKNVQNIFHSILTTISLPLLAKNQNDPKKINNTYLNLLKYSSVFSIPLFSAGIILGEEIFHVIFATKWFPMIEVFKVACVVQIVRLINSPNEDMFIAIGKPHLSLIMNIFTTLILGCSFLAAVKWNGMQGLMLIWIIVYPIIIFGWTAFVIHYRNIKLSIYFKNLRASLLSTTAMIFIIYILKIFILTSLDNTNKIDILFKLVLLILSGAITYIATLHLLKKIA